MFFGTLVRHLVGENGHVDRDCSTEDAEREGPKPQQKGHVGGYLSVEVRREHLSLFICKLTIGVVLTDKTIYMTINDHSPGT